MSGRAAATQLQLRVSGALLILGLLVEAISLHWNTAPSFLWFMMLGGGCFVAGVAVYLYSLIGPKNAPASGEGE